MSRRAERRSSRDSSSSGSLPSSEISESGWTELLARRIKMTTGVREKKDAGCNTGISIVLIIINEQGIPRCGLGLVQEMFIFEFFEFDHFDGMRRSRE